MTTLRNARLAAVRAHPASPLITDCTQGRVELSHATFDNWVTKTVNFLQTEADLDDGSTIDLDLPLHWMTAVWCVAAWEAGANVGFGATEADLRVGTGAGADILVVADPLGMGPVPAGVDASWAFPADVRSQPDQLIMPPAGEGAIPGMTAEDLYTAATGFAQQRGLQAGGRLQTELPVTGLDGALAAIAAPLAVDACVVYGPDSPQEPATARA